VLFCYPTPTESQAVRSRTTHRKHRRVQQVRTNFTSFFRVIYAGNENAIDDLGVAADLLAFTYNGKFMPRFSNDEMPEAVVDYNDPYERRMELVEVLEVESRRHLDEDDIRYLQWNTTLSNLNVVLRVTGSCYGCPQQSTFTNQVQQRRQLKSSKSGKGKGGEYYPSEPIIPTTTVPPERVDNGSSSPPIQTSVPVDPADLPTEEELRFAYAQEIRKKDLNILDVISLDEAND